MSLQTPFCCAHRDIDYFYGVPRNSSVTMAVNRRDSVAELFPQGARDMIIISTADARMGTLLLAH